MPYDQAIGATPRGGRRHTFAHSHDATQYDHEVLEISRVVRVVKGGRRFRFRATVVVGNRSGTVGFGVGKSKDVQEAIQKAQQQANKRVIKFELKNNTIPHPILTKYKGASILLKPAKPGTGVIAGSTVRIVADLAGIKDLVSKRFGSSNRISNVRATLRALERLGQAQRRSQSTKKKSNA